MLAALPVRLARATAWISIAACALAPISPIFAENSSRPGTVPPAAPEDSSGKPALSATAPVRGGSETPACLCSRATNGGLLPLALAGSATTGLTDLDAAYAGAGDPAEPAPDFARAVDVPSALAPGSPLACTAPWASSETSLEPSVLFPAPDGDLFSSEPSPDPSFFSAEDPDPLLDSLLRSSASPSAPGVERSPFDDLDNDPLLDPIPPSSLEVPLTSDKPYVALEHLQAHRERSGVPRHEVVALGDPALEGLRPSATVFAAGSSQEGNYDLTISRHAVNGTSGRTTSTAVFFTRAGNGVPIAAGLGIAYLLARHTGNNRLAEASSLSFEALISTGLWVTLLKDLVAASVPRRIRTGSSSSTGRRTAPRSLPVISPRALFRSDPPLFAAEGSWRRRPPAPPLSRRHRAIRDSGHLRPTPTAFAGDLSPPGTPGLEPSSIGRLPTRCLMPCSRAPRPPRSSAAGGRPPVRRGPSNLPCLPRPRLAAFPDKPSGGRRLADPHGSGLHRDEVVALGDPDVEFTLPVVIAHLFCLPIDRRQHPRTHRAARSGPGYGRTRPTASRRSSPARQRRARVRGAGRLVPSRAAPGNDRLADLPALGRALSRAPIGQVVEIAARQRPSQGTRCVLPVREAREQLLRSGHSMGGLTVVIVFAHVYTDEMGDGSPTGRGRHVVTRRAPASSSDVVRGASSATASGASRSRATDAWGRSPSPPIYDPDKGLGVGYGSAGDWCAVPDDAARALARSRTTFTRTPSAHVRH